MYFVPDGTKECGYYECKKCGYRFLSLQTMKKIACPFFVHFCLLKILILFLAYV